MDGIKLAIRFSYITNMLSYCGPKDSPVKLLEYFESGTNKDEVIDYFKKFEGLYPYLSSIAEKHDKNFLDYDVVEAYWIGNELLDAFTKKDIIEIVRKLEKRGLPKSMADDLVKRMPDGFVPHHNFNVFFVGVGNTAGTVETNIQNMDNCRISVGKVLERHGSNFIVETNSLVSEKNKIFHGEKETKTAVYLPLMIPDIKPGDYVALHWGFICKVLNKKQKEMIENITEKILHIRNSTI